MSGRPDDNPLTRWVAEQRADNEAFKAKIEAEIRLQWLIVAGVCFGVGALAIVLVAIR